MPASEAFRQALAAAGVGADRPATVLCDGDAGLWRLRRAVLPGATLVLDWWHAAVRFEHALQGARSLGAGTADARIADTAVRGLERAKWRLWHGTAVLNGTFEDAFRRRHPGFRPANNDRRPTAAAA